MFKNFFCLYFALGKVLAKLHVELNYLDTCSNIGEEIYQASSESEILYKCSD